MNLQQLRFVREAARHNFNLTQAAAAIGTSQPALSRGILELEAELKVAIFVRHGKRILGLSDPGKVILARAERVLAEVTGIEQASADYHKRDAGELRIATTHTQARYVLPAVIREFRKRYPAVRLSLLQGNPQQILQHVLQREADVAIATEVPAEATDLLTIPAFDWEHAVLAREGHPVFGQPLSLPHLAGFPIVTYVEAFAGRRRIDRAFAQAGLEPDIVLEAIDSDVIKTYVALGTGVGIIAGLAYDPARDRGLAAQPAGFLFGRNPVRLAVRRDVYLRKFAMAFIELFAPAADRSELERIQAGFEATGAQ
ncbi:MAG TPA: CysB family HTH-type transcriptional regulator [Burkholderiaceae bacterium]|nr:CysB family HTH-type transcriptional regulator [Burkholderiaceae bacterium]